MSSAAAAVQRNASCPCGSGKRYKHCCGAGGGAARAVTAAAVRQPAIPQYVGWEALEAAERAALWDKMLHALAAQRDFRFDLAGPLYEEVLARAPLTFDALHMLGAVRLMQGDYDVSESLLTRARELAPDDEK